MTTTGLDIERTRTIAVDRVRASAYSLSSASSRRDSGSLRRWRAAGQRSTKTHAAPPPLRSRRWTRSCGGSTSAWSSWTAAAVEAEDSVKVSPRVAFNPADRTSRPPPPAPASPPPSPPTPAPSLGDLSAARCGGGEGGTCTSLYSTVESNLVAVERSGGSGSSGGAAASSGGEVERASPPRSERASKAGLDFLRSRIRRITEAEDSARTDDRGWSSRSPRPASDSLGNCSGAAAAGSPDERSVGATSLTALPHEGRAS